MNKLSPSQSLRFRLPLFVLLGVLSPVLIGTIISSSRASQFIRNKTEENLTLQAKSLENGISRWIETNTLAVQNLSKHPSITSLESPKQKPSLENILKTYKHLYLAHTVNLDGINIARSDNKAPKNYSDRAWFKGAMAGNDITYQTLIGRTTKKPALCMATPIVQQKAIAAAINICSHLDDVTKQAGAVGFGKTGFAFVIDNVGQVVAHPNAELTSGDKLTDYSYYPPVKRFLEGKQDYLTFVDSQNIEWVSQAVRLENGWGIFILQQKAEAFQEERRFKQISVLIGSITILVVSGITWFLAGNLVKPLKRLTDAAQQMSDGDLNQSVELNTNDELGILASSFNSMTKQLQESFAFLENSNEELEIRVKERTAELEVANQTKDKFLANFSHELRTPLNGILGYAKIIQRGRNLDRTQMEGLNIIENSGNYLLNLINDILDFSAGTLDKIELSPQNCDLYNLLTAVVGIIQISAKEKNILFKYKASELLPKGVSADEKRLKQVLINLLGNAIKFTEKGKVTLTVSNLDVLDDNDYDEVPKQTVRFKIEDTGVGISPENIQKIFQPFEQVGDEESRRKGTGLGLSITNDLVDLMGGKLEVSSQLGIGSTFWFDVTFPVVTLEESDRANVLNTVQGYKGERRRILVVDDTKENCSLLLDLLQPLGFDIITAENGQVGIQLASEYLPDLILTDLFMIKMTGFTMVRSLRRMPQLEQTPIIAISANDSDVIKNVSFDSGCNEFLQKPLDADKLLTMISTHLELEWLQEENENDTGDLDIYNLDLHKEASLWEQQQV